MARTADYTIQGFLYQFNKTLLEILNADDDVEITVEGIVEDIEIAVPAGVTAIQCKYHEAQEKFTPSLIYKPLLQMMAHFVDNATSDIKYILFAHFPNDGGVAFQKTHLEAALQSKNQDLDKYIQAVSGKVNLDEFLLRFQLEFGPSLDTLANQACSALKAAGIPEADIETLAYPNAIQHIVNLAIQHDVSARRITRRTLVSSLLHIRTTAISRWTLSLKTRKQILDSRRKQLKVNLDKNARVRYFVVSKSSLEDFDSNIVTFISDYLDKYHFKVAHIHPPVFCLDVTEEEFQDIQVRLHKRGIVAETGYVASYFDDEWFFRVPMTQMDKQRKVVMEFSLRLLRWEPNGLVLNRRKCQDLFLLGSDAYVGLDTEDVNVESLAASSLKEIKYMMGVNDVYEQDWASGLVRA